MVSLIETAVIPRFWNLRSIYVRTLVFALIDFFWFVIAGRKTKLTHVVFTAKMAVMKPFCSFGSSYARVPVC